MATTKLAEADQMTIEEFLAFYDARPDGEKWELIEGIAVMSPSPTDRQQIICGNILADLLARRCAAHASWLPMIGIGTRVPLAPRSLPQPDVFVKEGPAAGAFITDDAMIIFEILSKSNTRADQAWRRRVYASVPNCQHYITVATGTAIVTRHDRATSWIGQEYKGLAEVLPIPAIEHSIALRAIYELTPFK